jgi:hypothetical protein
MGRAGFEWHAGASKTWQPKHRDGGGVNPRSREAVRLVRALRSTTVPVGMRGGCRCCTRVIALVCTWRDKPAVCSGVAAAPLFDHEGEQSCTYCAAR